MIGLVGKRGVGKDTVAGILGEISAYRTRRAFADPLKAAVSEIFRIPLETLNDPEAKESVDAYWGETPRSLLQRIGTELFREGLRREFPRMFPGGPASPSVWIRSFDRWLAEQSPEAGGVVVTDVRFPDEYAYLRSKGAFMIRITRPGRHNPNPESDSESAHRPNLRNRWEAWIWERAWVRWFGGWLAWLNPFRMGGPCVHASETALDDTARFPADCEILNDGTLEDLRLAVQRVVL